MSGFIGELFAGSLRMDILESVAESAPRPEFEALTERLGRFLSEEIRPGEIDAAGEFPPELLARLRELGLFALRIPAEYGGLGLSAPEYGQLLTLLARRDGSLAAMLFGHNSLGVVEPLLRRGRAEQKRAFLPRAAAGAIGAFALSEAEAGSDPARMQAAVRRTPEGDYVLDGEKLWTTNAPIADFVFVVAKGPEEGGFTAFVVETRRPGVSVGPRTRLLGLRALPIAPMSFRAVKLSAAERLGAEGEGLTTALDCLARARNLLPSVSFGAIAACVAAAREWTGRRVQGGRALGGHEAPALRLAELEAASFAARALAGLTRRSAQREGAGLALDGAAAKVFASEWAWRIADEAAQLGGARGLESESSQVARGEAPLGLERLLRDARLGRIFGGSNEILRLLLGRAALGPHRRAAAGGTWARLGLLGRYASWWLEGFLPRACPGKGEMAGHLRFAAGAARRLARAVFHAELVHGSELMLRQGTLLRFADIAIEIYAMAAAALEARRVGASQIHQAELFCRGARRRVGRIFCDLASNDDALAR